jgi:putative SOS response-associated peptidase YedK
MCSDYRIRVERVPIEDYFAGRGLMLAYPEGIPNFEPRDDVRITDRAPIVRAASAQPGAVEPGGRQRLALLSVELVQRRWSWPGPGGKPVYNFRSEGRDLRRGRCLVLADGFYEFTAHRDPKSKRKHKWLFTLKNEPWFGIAGLWRSDATVGEAFTMLTCAPSPDVAPYHSRSIVVLARDDWARWLDPAIPSRELLQPLPAGSFEIAQIN